MKGLTYSCSCLFLFCLSCLTVMGQGFYIVQGQVENPDDSIFYINPHVDGVYVHDPLMKSAIETRPDRDGKFTQKVPLEKPGLVGVRIHDKQMKDIMLWAAPGKTSQFTAKVEGFETTVSFDGDFKGENGFMYGLKLPTEWAVMSQFRMKKSVGMVVTALEEQKQAFLDQLREAEQAESFDAGFVAFMEKGIEVSFEASMALVSQDHVFSAREGKNGFDQETIADWDKAWAGVYERVDINGPEILTALSAHILLENYLNFNFRDADPIELLKGNTFDSQEEFFHHLQLQVIREKIKGGTKEYFWAFYLLSAALQSNFEKVLLQSFEGFKDQYPNSLYIPKVQPYIAPIKEFHQKKEGALPEGIHMVDSAQKIVTFEELVAPYTGYVLYIDLWATWCGPCKQEFSFKEGLYGFAADKPIKFLYISSDRPEKDQKWRDMVRFYGLKGDNFRVDEPLNHKIWEALGVSGSRSIPRYIIVDKEGNIVEKNAKRPSDQEGLYEQLQAYF